MSPELLFGNELVAVGTLESENERIFIKSQISTIKFNKITLVSLLQHPCRLLQFWDVSAACVGANFFDL